MRRLDPLPLDATAYAPYGDVIAARASGGRIANQGRARAWDRLGELHNARPGAAPNLGVFRSDPWPDPTVPVRVLERHPHSTQLFVPMAASRYLVVVARGGDRPDLATLAAFLAGPDQAITYRAGTWHHPLLALDRPTDFACLVWEDGTEADCHLVTFDPVQDEVWVPA